MKILPYRTYTFCTSLSANDVRQRIKEIIALPLSSRNPKLKTDEYDGRVYDDEFELQLRGGFRKMMLPLINGKFRQDGNGCRVFVTVKLPLYGILGGAFWCAALLFEIIRSLTVTEEPLASVGVYVLFGMLAFGYILIIGPFIVHAYSAKQDLSQILGCEPQ